MSAQHRRDPDHYYGAKDTDSPDKAARVTALLKMRTLIASGYAGILANGNIVDRREHPEAIPCQKNSLLSTPDPKEVKGKR